MSEEIPRRQKPKNAPPPPERLSIDSAGVEVGQVREARDSRPADARRRVTLDASCSRTSATTPLVCSVACSSAVLVLTLIAYGINGVARWNARRVAAKSGSRQELEKRSRENVLVIGVKDGKATGFLALRVDSKGDQIFGVAIPDGAFIEVPGQGFERIGRELR